MNKGRSNSVLRDQALLLNVVPSETKGTRLPLEAEFLKDSTDVSSSTIGLGASSLVVSLLVVALLSILGVSLLVILLAAALLVARTGLRTSGRSSGTGRVRRSGRVRSTSRIGGSSSGGR